LVGGVMPATFTIAEDNKTYDLSGQAGPLMEILQILKANGIGINNMIDLRSNPAARAQVQAVVRRAAVGQQAPAAAPAAPYMAPAAPPPPPEPTTAQRLQELETLRATGAISDDEYNAKRQQILTDL
jgi:pyruvate/2-oxoglutarate dehydrogenase complex dihydrolipoamide acyltransferase (E2) component